MTEYQVKHFAIRLLSQIFAKHLQKCFATWSTTVTLIKHSYKRKTLLLKISPESPIEKSEKLPRSPTSTTTRLYELSKTQKKKRENLISLNLPKYSFSPKVNSSSDKRRSLQQMKPVNPEPLAVVSACSVSSSLQSTFNRSLTPNF